MSGKHKHGNLRSRIVGEGVEAPDQLLANPLNWRTHPKEQVDALEGLLREVGWVQRVIVNRTTGHIVDGHARVELALRRSESAVPVLYVELTEAEERLVLAALDPIGGLAGKDAAVLDELLQGVHTEDPALQELLDSLAGESASIGGTDGLTDPDDAPELQAEPVTKPGDVWECGRHRIVCGDSTSAEAWAALRVGESAVTFTSPPYGAGNVAKLRDHYVPGAKNRESFYAGHDDDPAKWLDLMNGWSSMALAHCGAVVCNVQMLADNKRDMVRWMAAHVDHLVDVVIWDKGSGAPQMQSNVLTNCFEFLFVLSRESGASRSVPFADFHGNIRNVVGVDPRGKNDFADVHRAVMPVDLVSWVIDLCKKAREFVDPFGGTGTTMIACEKSGRDSRLIEIDGRYVDVAVRRWQAFTGKAATLESDGRTFDEVEAERGTVEA